MKTNVTIPGWRQPLLGQLRWFIGLRWFAGAAVAIAALIDWSVTRWFGSDLGRMGIGVGILVYNLALWIALRRSPTRKFSRAHLLSFAWLQFLLDVIALAVLSVTTGGARSPLLGLFVLHMVFAGLLLPRVMAYGAVAATMLILGVALRFANLWPADREALLILTGWVGALLGTVLVATHIARALRRQRGQVVRMSRQLRRQQRAMMQSEKMSALGQMAAGVAHEIANPLASMDSLLQLMQRKPERLTAQSIATLREQVERIGRIVRELTTFSRPVEANWQTLPLNDVVRDSLGMLSFDNRLRRVEVEQHFSNDVGSIPLLPQALQQVLINLIRNALDAMEETPLPRLRLRTAREDDWCIIEISDNGQGIEPRNLRRLFEPFFTTKPLGKGTGLGLSISYALIQKHGGSISARSKPGEGATFVVKLPLDLHRAVVNS